MKSKTIVTDKKTTIIVIILAIVLFSSGCFIGHYSSKCKCNCDGNKQEQNINQSR